MAPGISILLLVFTLAAQNGTAAQRARPRPLTGADVDAIVQLVKLEDARQFDEPVLAALIKSAHPEVRRRAIVAIGRIVDPRGRALLAGLRGETNPDLLATIAFATGSSLFIPPESVRE